MTSANETTDFEEEKDETTLEIIPEGKDSANRTFIIRSLFKRQEKGSENRTFFSTFFNKRKEPPASSTAPPMVSSSQNETTKVVEPEKPLPSVSLNETLDVDDDASTNALHVPSSFAANETETNQTTTTAVQEPPQVITLSSESSSNTTNQTVIVVSETPPPQVLVQPPTGMIVIPQQQPLPPQLRVIRRGLPTTVDPQQQQRPISQNSLLLVDLVASVLATATRLWFLRWLTGWIAQQEESIQPSQHFVWERLNDRYERDASALRTAIQLPPEGVSIRTWRRKHLRFHGKRPRDAVDLRRVFTKTVVVVELQSDSKEGMNVAYLADLVSFLIQQHRQYAFGVREDNGRMGLEVVFLVKSPGGSVSSFGLAAAQIQRLKKEPGIRTTVCVDQYAASGGYMIASQADKIVAAPFSTIGSVGVIMEGLNFHEIAKRYGIQPLVIKAGNSKNPFTTFGPISRHDLQQEQVRLEKVHDAFKALIVSARPMLQERLEVVADGSVFLGQEALDLKLVDQIMTSSDYIQERVFAGDRVLMLHRSNPTRFARRVGALDLLPHLRRVLLQPLVGSLVQTTSVLGFLHHLYCQYFDPKLR